MKKIVFVICMLMLIVSGAFAQTSIESETSTFVIDLGTFTGIVAIVSTLVTQVLKVIPAIKDSTAAKICVSVVVGIVVCVLSWALRLTPLLAGVPWWESALYGIAVGLSGCGFYDVVKAIGNLFRKREV